jgi:hypothetical protein
VKVRSYQNNHERSGPISGGQVTRELAGRNLSDEVNHREQNLKLVRLAMVRVAQAVVEGEIKMTLSDLDKLIRLEAFLRDEPDSRQEVVFADLKDKSREELAEMVRSEVALLKEIGHVEPE